MSSIREFSGSYRFLSNFWLCKVPFEDVTWPSLEHAFVAAKTLDPAERNQILQIHSPGQVKRYGRKLTLRPGWEEMRVDVMRQLLASKFAPGSTLATILALTSPNTLVEGNHWHDQFWGDCTCERVSCSAPGQNHLGRLLMDHRSFLIVGK